MSKKIAETINIMQAIAPVDIATDRTSSYFPMDNYRQVQGVVTTALIAQEKNVTIQLLQATSAVGAGSKPLTEEVEVVAGTGGEPLTAVVEADVTELDEGFTHVAIKVTSDTESAVNGAALLIRANGRYGSDRA